MSSIEQTYNHIASKFSQTRQKVRPEFDLILSYISDYCFISKNLTSGEFVVENDVFDWSSNPATTKTTKSQNKSKKSQKIRILDFGCGDGRLFTFLKNNLNWADLEYIGIDISNSLISIARNQNPNTKFIYQDMIEFAKKVEQNTIDIVINLASYQHIMKRSDRIVFAKLVYKMLKYNWLRININRSKSSRFAQKYKKEILLSKIKNIISFGFWDSKNVQIPFEIGWKKHFRDYHIFDILELKKIWQYCGLDTKTFKFSDKTWILSDDISNSRNSFVVRCKKAF